MKINLLKLSFVLFFPVIILLLPACSQQQENFDWLIGQWVRINDTEGSTTYEFWEKKREREYIGSGFTIQQSDTIWKENIRLQKKDGGWNFEVIGMNDPEPTIFLMSSFKDDRFVVENKANEFPKKIEYRMVNKNMHAVISGGGPEILFEFKELNP